MKFLELLLSEYKSLRESMDNKVGSLELAISKEGGGFERLTQN